MESEQHHRVAEAFGQADRFTPGLTPQDPSVRPRGTAPDPGEPVRLAVSFWDAETGEHLAAMPPLEVKDQSAWEFPMEGPLRDRPVQCVVGELGGYNRGGKNLTASIFIRAGWDRAILHVDVAQWRVKLTPRGYTEAGLRERNEEIAVVAAALRS